LGITVPSGFDFRTTKQVDLSVSAVTRGGSAIPHVVYRVYDGNPSKGGTQMSQIRSNDQGTALTAMDIPGHLSELWLTSDYIGVAPIAVLPITWCQVIYSLDAFKTQ
jgi:hypothetical protein